MTLRSKTPIMLALALIAGACSLLVSPEKGAIKCEVSKGSKDPCPTAMTCIDKTCQTVPAGREEKCDDGIDNDGDDMVDEHDDSVAERCDKEDNDCDGENNEGFSDRVEYCDTVDNNCNGETDEESDQDDDGFTSCGNLEEGKMPDCEPMQAAAYPGGKEICDGLDNDCDRTEDNAPSASESLCPNKDELCLMGRCVRKTCAVKESGVTCKANEVCVDDKCVPMDCATPCGSGQFCDMTTTPPTCKDRQLQRKIGDACSIDNECESRLCIDGDALNLTSPRRVCGKACCSDSQCGAGESCLAASTGARSCLPRTMISNTYPVGSKACSAISTTNDAGVAVPQCPAPQVCAVETVSQAPSGARIATSACRTPNPLLERPVAEGCSTATNCNTRLCQPIVLSSVCTTPCNVSSDCAKLAEYQTVVPVHGYCQYVDYGEYSASTGVNYGPMCVVTPDAQPAGPPIKDCRAGTDCPDLTCIGFSALMNRPGKCAPTCCEDRQCTTLRADARCLPVARGTKRYEMRCMEQP